MLVLAARSAWCGVPGQGSSAAHGVFLPPVGSSRPRLEAAALACVLLSTGVIQVEAEAHCSVCSVRTFRFKSH